MAPGAAAAARVASSDAVRRVGRARRAGHGGPREEDVFDRETLQAIGELLALGEQRGFGITFVPDAEAWTVGYLRGMSGADLVTGYDLGDTARAAVRPIEELAARCERARLEREAGRGSS